MRIFSKISGKDKPLWEGYYGGNDENSLQRKADAFSLHIFNMANSLHKQILESLDELADGSENVKELSEKIKSVSDKKLNQFLFEILYFFLHIADRTAFSKLSKEQRNIFMDRLQENVVTEICKQGTEVECKSFPKQLNDRHVHYSQYKKLMAKTNEGTKDSLVANFSYQMSELLVGRDELLVSLPIQITTSNYIIGLKLPELLEDRSRRI